MKPLPTNKKKDWKKNTDKRIMKEKPIDRGQGENTSKSKTP
jgi:hypothetical protein